MGGLEVHLSLFTKVCLFWPSLIKFCPLRPSEIKERLRALHFLPCFLLSLGEPLRSAETKYLELTQDSKLYWSSLQKESIFKRITCGPWGEPKKSISPPAPVEPPGFLQRWWWWWDVRGSSCTILSTLKPIYECNIYAIKPLRLEGVKSNIARIANAVQVTICLLVSTNLNLNRCHCSVTVVSL